MGQSLPSLKIESGLIRLAINDDPGRVIAFNPKDVVFAEKFYRLIKDFEDKQAEFETQAKELDAVEETDELGLPINTEERLAYIKEICEFTFEKIDEVFGEGTSEKVFEGVYNLDIIGQFFDGISPYIKAARTQRVEKYSKVIADRKAIEETKAVMD
jgi:hypothetical protein